MENLIQKALEGKEFEYKGEKLLSMRIMDAEYLDLIRNEPMGTVFFPDVIKKYDEAPLEKKQEVQKIYSIFKIEMNGNFIKSKKEFFVTNKGVYKANTPEVQVMELLQDKATMIDEDPTVFTRLEELYV